MSNDAERELGLVDLTNQTLEVMRKNHQDEDYEYVRNNLQDIIAKGGSALDGILELAKDSDHPRAWEVVGQIMRQLSETNKDLIELQKDMKKIKDEEGAKNVTQNAIFLGSTNELQKFLRDQGHVSQKLKDSKRKKSDG
jgi:5-bromo-4-chloroindolyl phosphate hydrolysis protein